MPDLNKTQAMAALKQYRRKYFGEDLSSEILEQVYDHVGGRLSFLSRVAKADDMIKMCHTICAAEKTWFLNKCWILGEEMDDDVMDEQKYSVCNPSAIVGASSLTLCSLQPWSSRKLSWNGRKR